jgi:hypothetical protein
MATALCVAKVMALRETNVDGFRYEILDRTNEEDLDSVAIVHVRAFVGEILTFNGCN